MLIPGEEGGSDKKMTGELVVSPFRGAIADFGLTLGFQNETAI